ncbi:MAG: tetratricopeptide repeat protein [Chloroflexi bacterium]|nr:tetratricopeptide repeat protein [Chloroflexota bacterium]
MTDEMVSQAKNIAIYPRDYDGLHRAELRPAPLRLEPSATRAQYEEFRALVLERTGLEAPEFNPDGLARGLAEAIEQAECANLEQFYTRLRSNSANSLAWDRLVGALTVGETYFFRNTAHFDVLAQSLLPELIAQRQRADRRLRIWSAGCATGEEPYSLAILLCEILPYLDGWNILILATDINRDALRRAQDGVYAPWSFRGVEKRIQETYFTPLDGKQVLIADKVKRMVTFDYLNLVADPYPTLASNTNAMDLILCRNVTIYFKADVTRLVLRNLNSALIPGGWLIPGAAEPNMLYYDEFEAHNFPGAVVYQKPRPGLSKPTRAAPMPAFAPEPPVPQVASALPKPPAPDPYRAALDLAQNGRIDEALAKLYEKLDQDPGFVPTCYTLGKVYANKGQLDQAQHWCERAIAQDRLRPEPYYTLALVYQEQGLQDMALDTLKKALYLNREFVLAHYHLAQLYRAQGEHDLARKSLQNVERLLNGKPRDESVPEGDGLVVGRLLELVANQLDSARVD